MDARDVARMLVSALDFGSDELFDAGTGESMSVLDVATFVAKTVGVPLRVEHYPMRRGEKYLPKNALRAKGEGWDKLDWRPYFSAGRLAEVVRSYA